jgi:hypothetical protein
MLFSIRRAIVKPWCWACQLFSLGFFQGYSGTAAGNSGTPPPAIPPVNLVRDSEATTFYFVIFQNLQIWTLSVFGIPTCETVSCPTITGPPLLSHA